MLKSQPHPCFLQNRPCSGVLSLFFLQGAGICLLLLTLGCAAVLLCVWYSALAQHHLDHLQIFIWEKPGELPWSWWKHKQEHQPRMWAAVRGKTAMK